MLTFDEAAHRYEFNGVEVPSVTQILKVIDGDILAGIPPDVLERKRQIGTATHRAIELMHNNELDWETVDEAVLGYLNAWAAFIADTDFKVGLFEHRVYHETLGYAGTLDLFGVLSGKPTLIDIKTSAAIYPSVGPQTAGYLHALAVDADRYAVQLKPDGSYKLHPCKNRRDLNVFLAALTIYKFKKETA